MGCLPPLSSDVIRARIQTKAPHENPVIWRGDFFDDHHTRTPANDVPSHHRKCARRDSNP